MISFWGSFVIPALIATVISVLISLREKLVDRAASTIFDWLYDLRTTEKSAKKRFEDLRQKEYLKIYAGSDNLAGNAVLVYQQQIVNTNKAVALALSQLTKKERRLLDCSSKPS
jgi:hypothetical protein